MAAVWLDVTTIFGWHRPAVGVVRVETECALFAITNRNLGFRFCRFDNGTGCYIEIEISQMQLLLDRITGQSNLDEKHHASEKMVTQQPPRSIEDRLAAVIWSLINVLPKKLGKRVASFAASRKPAISAAIRSLREARTAFVELVRPSNQPRGAHNSPKPRRDNAVPFQSADTYISMGLDWDQKDLVLLYSEKKRVGFKVVLFCYDVIPVKFPHLCVGDVASKFALYFANLAWCADRILCISKCTQLDLYGLLQQLGTPTPPMTVIRLGCEVEKLVGIASIDEVRDALQSKFILYVSTIERRKNHEVLYRAYARLIDSGSKNLPLLIFVGMPGWGVDDLLADLRFDPRIRPYIRILHNVPDSDLTLLYKNSYFTVFPSLYEGWGLPVAESLSHGKFCLAADVASLPEVGGDLIEYLDPWDVPAWANRLDWYFRNEQEVKAKECQIRDRYIAQSWNSCANDIFKNTAWGKSSG